MIRTFIAVDLPSPVQAVLERFERELRKADATVAWIRPDRIHLTLKFLGNVAPERIPALREALESVSRTVSPFRLQAAGCGAFPTIRQMRVIWVGLRGDADRLGDLKQKIEAATVPLGFESEDRPFKPHLTLGRVKGRGRLSVLQEILMANQSFEAEAFDVAEVVLYKSDLKPDGAQYTPLFRAPFTGRPE
ncbi:RNA 2',3'-cyclic phosphodiesterase [Syntrophobacter fumaroxidans]|uniref:RNA 2',3'-cyclic phosphodiesterase n=1 Tax=Syntrophobacter fumaroxidans (strain DSM 10017 / MPOB) TaxID=335543 RepID=A0LLA5_SYNFM|nr:RNA 2',3'-cyclic phosphodiesterase [Syntrophobacter fumaroxidans]ABK18207.1 2'-5' RNA ligase [Syntrophobacter fumaroxidans MPOB]